MPMMPGRNDENSPYLFMDYFVYDPVHVFILCVYEAIICTPNTAVRVSKTLLSIGISTAAENIHFRHRRRKLLAYSSIEVSLHHVVKWIMLWGGALPFYVESTSKTFCRM